MILRFLLDNFRMVRLGSTRAGRKLFFQLQKERDALTAQGIDPTTKLLAQRLGVTEVDVHDVDQHMRAPALSFDSPVGGESSDRQLSEVVSNQDELMSNFFAQPDALAVGARKLRDERGGGRHGAGAVGRHYDAALRGQRARRWRP